MAYGCSNDLSQQATGNGAKSADEIGFQLHTSLKEGDFSSLAYYTPDSQAIKTYYDVTAKSKDADTRRNIWHYAQHITDKLKKEFRQARQEATSKGITWDRAKLDSVAVNTPHETKHFVTVSVFISTSIRQYHFSAKCVQVNELWFIGEKIRFEKARKIEIQ